MSILSLLCIIPLIYGQIEISKFKDKSGIFYEEREVVGLTRTAWDIVVHVNITDYWLYKDKLDESMKLIRNKQNSLSSEVYTAATIDQLSARYQRVNQNNDIIVLNKLRRQRVPRSPLAFVGSIYHTLFGLMDEEHAEELMQKIRSIHSNEEYLLSLAKNQSSIQDMTVDILKQQHEVVWKNFRFINNSIHKLNEVINNQMDIELLQSTITSTLLAMESFEEIQHDIIDVIWNSKGNFLEKILPLHKFQEQIKMITSSISENLLLPDLDPIELAKVAKLPPELLQNSSFSIFAFH